MLYILVIIYSLSSYTLNSVADQGYRWKTLPIIMEVNSENADLPHSEVLRVLANTTDSWNSAAGINVLNIDSDSYNTKSSKTMSLDGHNSIGFSKNFFDDSNGFDPDVVVAVGGQYGKGGVMTDGFVLFNSESVVWETDKYAKNTDAYIDDFESIALHELGHVLGLGHSEYSNAVMSAQRVSRVKRTLTQDDIDGILFLTTTQSSMGSKASFGCGQVKNASDTNSNIYLFLLLLPVLSLIIYRKKLTNRS